MGNKINNESSIRGTGWSDFATHLTQHITDTKKFISSLKYYKVYLILILVLLNF
jgi:hypothetical protein